MPFRRRECGGYVALAALDFVSPMRRCEVRSPTMSKFCEQRSGVTSALRVGHYTCEAFPRRRTFARHDYAVLQFFTQGRAQMVQRTTVAVGAGDVLIVPAGEPHRLAQVHQTAAWGIGVQVACYVHAEISPLLDVFGRTRAGASSVVHIPGNRQQYLHELFVELQHEVSAGAGSAFTDVVQKSLLGLILAQVQRAAVDVPVQARLPAVVCEALAFIEQHCFEGISLRDVADAVHRSPAYVTTMLRQATGRTAVEWITAGRMAEAANWLARTDELVENIAERVGYADTTHFIRMFRRAFTSTPHAWRVAHRRSAVAGAVSLVHGS